MPQRIRMACVALACVALALGGTLTVTPPLAASPTTSQSAPGPRPDPAATHIAAEQNISLAEAEERLGWQQHATDLKTRVRASLGTARFGGLWIDPDDGDRLKVGVVGATGADRMTVANTAAAEGVADAVDMVAVRYSEARLRSAMDWSSGRLASVNKQAAWPLQLAHSVRANRLRLELPRQGTLTAAQQVLRGRLRSRYGAMLQEARYDGRPVGDACAFPYCDTPLRAGIRINGPVSGFCTGGFLARSKTDNKLYMITAGHCPWAGGTSTWWTLFPGGTTHHDLGPAHNGFWNLDGDMAIIRVINEAGWRPRAWVVVYASPANGGVSGTTYDPEYSITSDDASTEGQRICKTGVGSTTYRTSCGKVLDLGVTFTYTVLTRTETVAGLGKASYCRAGGDSGGPVYASHKAFGVHVANSGTCVSYYQGIKEVETDMNVNVAHDAP
jgi:hypothetical protein